MHQPGRYPAQPLLGVRYFLLLFLGITAIAVLVPARAHAEPDPDFFSTLDPVQKHATVDFLYQVSPVTASPPYSGTEEKIIAQHVAEVANAEPETATAFPEFSEELNAGIVQGGLAPGAYTVVTGIGAVGLAYGVYWQVGEEEYHLGLLLGSAAGGSTTGEGDFCYSEECGGALMWRNYGEPVYYGSVQQKPGAYLFVGKLNGNWWEPVRWFEKPCTFSGFTPPAGARMEIGVTTGVNCWFGEEAPVYVDYPYVTWQEVYVLGLPHPYDPEVDPKPTYITKAPEDPGVEVAEPGIEEVIDQGQTTQEWLEWVMVPAADEEEDPVKIGAPTEVELKQETNPCLAGPLTKTYDPGLPEGHEKGNFAAQAVLKYEFSEIDNPLKEETKEPVFLYWGDIGWGYRHISLRHGWTTYDREATGLALTSPDDRLIGRYPNARRYYKYYTGADGKTKCTRFVIVEWGVSSFWPSAEAAKARGVITSYSYESAKAKTPDPEPGIFE